MPPSIFVDGRSITLGSRIGRGGEGEVFALGNDATLALKLYTGPNLGDRESKVSAMIAAQLAKQAPPVAFPVSIARTNNGVFAGFVMRLVSGYKPLHELHAPGPRKQHFPQADYRFLVRAASNIARAIAAVHHNRPIKLS